ncbi:MAG: hypothetical protein GY910_11505 [bacterium]|nr:hypothetical protein [bacterium]
MRQLSCPPRDHGGPFHQGSGDRRGGVDDARELIESIRYAAAPRKSRIFIVDEVHMLSKSAFNALLKTLEEPPPPESLCLRHDGSGQDPLHRPLAMPAPRPPPDRARDRVGAPRGDLRVRGHPNLCLGDRCHRPRGRRLDVRRPDPAWADRLVSWRQRRRDHGRDRGGRRRSRRQACAPRDRTRTCLVGAPDWPCCLALDLPQPTQDRPGFVRNRLFTHGPGWIAHCQRDRTLVHIHPNVGGPLLHDRLLRMRLCRLQRQSASRVHTRASARLRTESVAP